MSALIMTSWDKGHHDDRDGDGVVCCYGRRVALPYSPLLTIHNILQHLLPYYEVVCIQ